MNLAQEPILIRVQQALSSVRWEWTFLDSSKCPANLSAALQEYMPHIEPTSWPERFWWGGVYVNGKQASADQALTAPCRIEYFEPKFNISEAAKYFPEFRTEHIIYEDEFLLVVYKPPRLPSLPSREQQRITLRSYLDNYVGSPVHMPSRLDTSAQGLVTVSKHKEAHHKLQKLFEQHLIKRYYLLQVHPRIDWEERRFEGAIGRSEAHQVLRKVVSGSEGKAATTDFRRIAEAEFLTQTGRPVISTILEACPHTGRTHQLRVHAAAMGSPIIGDNFYGGSWADELRLLSCKLSFAHPVSSKMLEVKIPRKLAPQWARDLI